MSETAAVKVHLGEHSTSVHIFCRTCSILGTEAIINLGVFLRWSCKIDLTSHQQYISGQNYLEVITIFCLDSDLRMFVGKDVERIIIGY